MKGNESKKEKKKEKMELKTAKVQSEYQREKSSKSTPDTFINKIKK